MEHHQEQCPHCQSTKARLCADHLGAVGWCEECGRGWIPEGQPRGNGLKKARSRG